MKRLRHANPEPLQFYWNGRAVTGRAGDSIAAALYANGIRHLGQSRKFHRPQGLSGSFVGSALARVDGRPNVRLDLEPLRAGLDARIQNVWPSPTIDLLSLARFIPKPWLYAGFEHNNMIRDHTRAYTVWEHSLAYLAGIADPPDPRLSTGPLPGTILRADTAIVGAGPAGCAAANEAASRGERVILVTRGESYARFARSMGETAPVLDPRVNLVVGMEAFGLYRQGRILACAPAQHDRPGIVIETSRTIIANGRRSCPPVVPGNNLPGVLDAHSAMMLADTYGVSPGNAVFVIGTHAQNAVAARLQARGVNVVGTAPVGDIRQIHGRKQVTAVETSQRIDCDCVVHAGPWRGDANLLFQTASAGLLQLRSTDRPENIQVIGSAADENEPVMVGPVGDATALVCPCMDVTWGEVARHVDAGETDVEVLKRVTACGMGPCQGTPCWDLMAALLSKLTSIPAEVFGHPSYRDPRRSLTVAQAAGLDGLVEAER